MFPGSPRGRLKCHRPPPSKCYQSVLLYTVGSEISTNHAHWGMWGVVQRSGIFPNSNSESLCLNCVTMNAINLYNPFKKTPLIYELGYFFFIYNSECQEMARHYLVTLGLLCQQENKCQALHKKGQAKCC